MFFRKRISGLTVGLRIYAQCMLPSMHVSELWNIIDTDGWIEFEAINASCR